ncbi:MAG TPA: RsmE family RNA methyltransferase [Acidimicrobiales bacterium]|nr:RsmE family RNA methyltransferase [Acidimicrobiales bacterium]
MLDELRRSAAHVFVDDLDAPALLDADAHHLGRVLRLRDGESVTVGDGRGGWRSCRFLAGGLDLDIDGETRRDPAPVVGITVGFALLKGDRPELVVAKLTELGVDRIVAVVAERAVVRWDDDKAGHGVDRLRRVAREAAMQSRRLWLPEVAPLTAVASLSDAALAEPGGRPPSLDRPVVIVGPEGGWTAAELAGAAATADLGPQVLRGETAAIAVAVLLTALRAGLVSPAR